MFRLVGTRKNGNLIDKSYDDIRVARFEFEVITPVAKEITLYSNEVILEHFKLEEVIDTKYILEGESVFNTIKRIFDKKTDAYKYFRLHKERCNWLALYESKNNNLKKLDLYIHGI